MNHQKEIKMENENFRRTIIVNASEADAMKKIGQVNLWWAKDFSVREEILNDKFTVRFGEHLLIF